MIAVDTVPGHQGAGQRAFNAATIERLIRMHPAGIGAKYAERNDLDKEIASYSEEAIAATSIA